MHVHWHLQKPIWSISGRSCFLPVFSWTIGKSGMHWCTWLIRIGCKSEESNETARKEVCDLKFLTKKIWNTPNIAGQSGYEIWNDGRFFMSASNHSSALWNLKILAIFEECFWPFIYFWNAGSWSWRKDWTACWQDRESTLTGLDCWHILLSFLALAVYFN